LSDGEIVFVSNLAGTNDGSIDAYSFYKISNATTNTFKLEIIDPAYPGVIMQWLGSYTNIDITSYTDCPCEERNIDDTTWRDSPAVLAAALDTGEWECGATSSACGYQYAGTPAGELAGAKAVGGTPVGAYNASNTNEDTAATITETT